MLFKVLLAVLALWAAFMLGSYVAIFPETGPIMADPDTRRATAADCLANMLGTLVIIVLLLLVRWLRHGV